METNLDAAFELVSETDYARFVGKTVDSVRNDRYAGRCPTFVKLGHTIKYPLDAVREYIDKNTRTPQISVPTLTGCQRGARGKP